MHKKTAIFVVFALFCCLFLLQTIAVAHDETNCCQNDYPILYLTHPYQKSAEISELQGVLYILGFYEDSLSGIYDEKTSLAVKSFQHAVGIASDGIVKYHVWLKLAKATEMLITDNKKMSPPTGQVHLIIDTFRRKLIIFNDDEVYAQFPIAIGKSDSPSPLGNWKVISKAHKDNTMLGTRWMGLDVPWGVYGIHGTNKPWTIGSMASHGCFRMFNKDVEILYPWVKWGSPVTVIGNPFGYMSGGLQIIKTGDSGSGVIYLQEKLARLGYYKARVDGAYGPGTTKAVKALQKSLGLPETGVVDTAEYKALGVSK